MQHHAVPPTLTLEHKLARHRAKEIRARRHKASKHLQHTHKEQEQRHRDLTEQLRQAQEQQRRLHRPTPSSPPQPQPPRRRLVASIAGASLWTGLCLALAPPSPSLGMLLWGVGAQLGLTALTWPWRAHHPLPIPAAAPRRWPHLMVQAACLSTAIALGLWLGAALSWLTGLSATLLCAVGLCLPTLVLQLRAFQRQKEHWLAHRRQRSWDSSVRRVNAAHRDLIRFQEHERPQAMSLALSTAAALRQAP